MPSGTLGAEKMRTSSPERVHTLHSAVIIALGIEFLTGAVRTQLRWYGHYGVRRIDDMTGDVVGRVAGPNSKVGFSFILRPLDSL